MLIEAIVAKIVPLGKRSAVSQCKDQTLDVNQMPRLREEACKALFDTPILSGTKRKLKF